MISKPTVLVLGAGASAPYGFPVGSKLMRDIYFMLETDKAKDLLFSLGFSHADISALRDSIPECGVNSIDALLEHRAELKDLGKACIAAALIPYEIHGRLFDIRNNESWYNYLFNKLNAPFEEFPLNQASIITYNYDRSLEHYLFTALKRLHNISDQDCVRALTAIPIIHLHGQLGYLPWQNQGYIRPYSNDVDPEIVRMSSQSIKIVHESVQADMDFQRANRFLRGAQAVYFMGFGYDPTNLGRLRLNPQSHCQGSVYNMSFGEINTVINQFKGLFDIDIVRAAWGQSQSLLEFDAYKFMREIDLS